MSVHMFLQTAVWQYVKTWVSVHVRTHACMAGDMSSRVLVNTSALCQRICRSNFKCESAHTSWRRMSGNMMQDIHMNIYICIYVYIYIFMCVCHCGHQEACQEMCQQVMCQGMCRKAINPLPDVMLAHQDIWTCVICQVMCQ